VAGALDTLEIASFVGGVVADVCLLLFVDLSGVDDFFNCALRDETEYFDVPALTDSEGTVLGLEIVCWIPVWIKENSVDQKRGVGGREYTLLAETMLRPTPPALVEMRKTNMWGSLLKRSTLFVPAVREGCGMDWYFLQETWNPRERNTYSHVGP
jgi:hypothetical protein